MKKAMVDEILQFPKLFFPAPRLETVFGKASFPTLPDSVQSINLTYFMGEDFCFFFAAFNLLHENLVSEWQKMQSFKRIHSVLAKFSVTSDATEREIMLAHDKLGSVLQDTRHQNITHVVEHDRAVVCDLRMPIRK